MKCALLLLFAPEKLYSDLLKRYSDENLWDRIIIEKDDVEDRLAKCLIDQAIEADLYFLSYDKRVRQWVHKYGHNVISVPINFGYGFGFEYSAFLFKELSLRKYDVIFVISSYYMNPFLPDMYDLVAFYCRKKRIPLISRFAGGGSFLLPIRYWIKKIALNVSSRIITASEKEAKTLMTRFGIKREKIVLMHNPVNLNRFYPMAKEESAMFLKKDSHKKYILFVGHLRRSKGVYDLIESFQQIVKDRKDVHLLLIGYGPEEKRILAEIKKKGLEKSVSFEGFIFDERLRWFYNLADVFVLPSYSEGAANVVYEAIACGTPVVAYSVGALPDIVKKCGILVEQGNISQLSDSILRILDGKFKIDCEACSKLLETCSMQHIGYRLKDVITEVIEEYRL